MVKFFFGNLKFRKILLKVIFWLGVLKIIPQRHVTMHVFNKTALPQLHYNFVRILFVSRATWRISQSKPKKPEKIIPENNSLYFRKLNFLVLIFKKFWYFGKWNPALYGPKPQNFSLKIFSYIFSKKQNTRSEKLSNVFLFFRKRNILSYTFL